MLKFVSIFFSDGEFEVGICYLYMYELGDDVNGGDFVVFDVKILDNIVINSFF